MCMSVRVCACVCVFVRVYVFSSVCVNVCVRVSLFVISQMIGLPKDSKPGVVCGCHSVFGLLFLIAFRNNSSPSHYNRYV